MIKTYIKNITWTPYWWLLLRVCSATRIVTICLDLNCAPHIEMKYREYVLALRWFPMYYSHTAIWGMTGTSPTFTNVYVCLSNCIVKTKYQNQLQLSRKTFHIDFLNQLFETIANGFHKWNWTCITKWADLPSQLHAVHIIHAGSGMYNGRAVISHSNDN